MNFYTQMDDRNRILNKFCEGHPVFSTLVHNWGTNKIVCITCGKEIKPEESDWKLKTKDNE